MKYVLTEPLAWAVLAGLVGAILSRFHRQASISFLIICSIVLLPFSLPVFSSRFLQSVEIVADPAPEYRKFKPEAIVILSAGLQTNAPEYGGVTINNLSLARVRYGAYLHRKHNLPILVAGGLWQDTEHLLASHMGKALRDEFKVPVKWLDQVSQNTFENAQESKRVLSTAGIETVYLVTHAFHMPRAIEAFENQNLKVVPAPTSFVYVDPTPNFQHFLPSSFALTQSRYAIGEIIGRMWYRIRYY